MSDERPCGYLLDSPDPSARVMEDVLLGTTDLVGWIPASASIQRPEWITQQRGSSCTGHYWAEAIYGMTGEKQSPYLPFYYGLMRDFGGREDAIDVANGVSMRSTIDAAREHGSCKWDLWNPASAGFRPTARPPALARLDAQRHNVDSVRIYASGGNAPVEAVCAAIAAGRPVGIVVRVDKEFDRPISGYVAPDSGLNVRGLHIITGWSYQTLLNGERRVRALAHWGKDFGVGGGVELDSDRIRKSPFLCYPTSLS